VKEGGWRAFREASKQKATAETATAELERPVVAHRAGIAPADAPVQQLHETKPGPVADAEPGDTGDTEEEEDDSDSVDATEGDDEIDADADEPDQGDEAPSEPRTLTAKLIADTRAMFALKSKDDGEPKLDLGPRFSIAHWSVLAIVPVAAAASLLAVRAGLNPYALCLQWWDLLFGTVFLTACVLFLGLAIWKRPSGVWHPGAPALIVAVAVLPFWAGSNAAFGSGCQEIPEAPLLVPPLPPPIDVPTLWTVPMPVPRPLELNLPSQDLRLPPQGEIQIHPPAL
jgi:hypothetical protein